MKRGELFLANGIVCAALGAALSHFVIIGLGGLALVAVAFVLLLRAGFIAGGNANIPFWRQIAGFTIYVVGVLFLFTVTLHVTSLAQDKVLLLQRGMPATTQMDWMLVLTCSVASASTVAVGLWLRTGWSPSRVLFWWSVALSVAPGAVMLFWVMARSQPITA